MSDFIDLAGKVVLVTGGSRGIGEGIVRALATEGADVVFSYRENAARATAIAEQLGAARCLPLAADLAELRDIEHLWTAAVGWKGHIDIIVNNAASREPIPPDASIKLYDAHWIHTLRVNLVSVAHLNRLAIEHFQTRSGGIIVAITGRSAVRGERPEFLADGAAKGGLNSMIRGIARFHAKQNIQAFLVCGGLIETDQTRAAMQRYGREEWLRESPLGRTGTPEDIARIVIFLCSGKAAYATGATIDAVGASFLH